MLPPWETEGMAQMQAPHHVSVRGGPALAPSVPSGLCNLFPQSADSVQ